MSELAEKAVAQIRFEIEQIDRLLTVYADLLEQVQRRTPNPVEMAAVASVLHSFYNGLENIFLSIAKGIDQHVPAGAQWHRDLLIQMSQQTVARGKIISPELTQRIADYLGFRHFYWHSYSFLLEWEELSGLVVSLRDIWTEAKKEFREFLETWRCRGR